jgi:2-polyprenyl-6-methoxyphenol hydroxylase-like FAD-dependent oxidoreductase
MSAPDLHVVVAGGGIGGLCLAQGLRKAGVSVAVYERDHSRGDRLDRYRLHISPAGSRALHACLPAAPWEQFLASAGRRGGGFGFLDQRLRQLVVVEDELMYPDTADPADSQYPVDRRRLRQVLLTGLDEVVHFDKQLDHYERARDGRVTVWFSDGTSATGDVLVGADGASSRVRGQYLPSAERTDTDAIGIGFRLPLTGHTRAWLPPRLATGMNLVLAAAPFFLFTSVFEPRQPDDGGPGGYILCAFVARRTACPAGLEQLEGAALQRAVLTMIDRWHPKLCRLVAEADPASAAQFPFLAAARVPPWEPTNVTLLGDAIHSMPPAGGNGANMALRDAHHLSVQLTLVAHGRQVLRRAIADYEEDMRDYGFAAVCEGLQTLRLGLVENRLLVSGIRAWFRLCNAVPALRRVGFRDNWANTARRRPWELDQSPAAGTSELPAHGSTCPRRAP